MNLEEQVKDIDKRVLILVRKGKLKKAREIIRKEYLPIYWKPIEDREKCAAEELQERLANATEKEKRYEKALAKYKEQKKKIDKQVNEQVEESAFATFKKKDLKAFLRKHRELCLSSNPNFMVKPALIKMLESASLRGLTKPDDVKAFINEGKEKDEAKLKRLKKKAEKKYGKEEVNL